MHCTMSCCCYDRPCVVRRTSYVIKAVRRTSCVVRAYVYMTYDARRTTNDARFILGTHEISPSEPERRPRNGCVGRFLCQKVQSPRRDRRVQLHFPRRQGHDAVSGSALSLEGE